MTNAQPLFARRHAIGLLAGPLLLGWGVGVRAASPQVSSAAAVPFPGSATILVAGPDGGNLGVWGNAVAAALDATLPPDTKVQTTCAGGVDGVTGANQFEARVPADGATLLLAPGAVTRDWLVGDSRVHFEAEHWVPVMAGVTPAIVMARADVPKLGTGRPIRLAASGPVGPQLPALLGLELLGAQVVPVFGVLGRGADNAAFAADKVDAVLACGQNVPQQVAALRKAGGKPLFGLGALDANGAPSRDPAFPDVPTLVELHVALHGTKPSGARFEAWRAAAAATQLEFGLVLPRLTSAALVALWRRAASQAVGQPPVQALTGSFAVRPLEGIAAAAAMSSVAVDAAALLELRGWLATRFNWRPA